MPPVSSSSLNSSPRIRVMFLIRSLANHGAERQLVELTTRLDTQQFDVTVVTFYSGTALEPEIEAHPQIRLLSLHKKGRWDVVGPFYGAWRMARELKPHVVHGYLSQPNLLALFLGKAIGARVVWGVRNTYTDYRLHDWFGRLELRFAPYLTRFVDLVIFNAESSRHRHEQLGYRPAKMLTIPIGFDTVRFCADRERGRSVRKTIGAAEGDLVIGIVGRLNAQKDHRTFLKVAAALSKDFESVRFVSVGSGPEGYRNEMVRLTAALGISDRVTWLESQHEMAEVYNALDILVSCSTEEGVSNVIGEAMACEVPCVVTDVGDSRRLVGDDALVVPAGDSVAMTRVASELVMDQGRRTELGRKARLRVQDLYGLPALVSRTSDALARLARPA